MANYHWNLTVHLICLLFAVSFALTKVGLAYYFDRRHKRIKSMSDYVVDGWICFSSYCAPIFILSTFFV